MPINPYQPPKGEPEQEPGAAFVQSHEWRQLVAIGAMALAVAWVIYILISPLWMVAR